MSNNFKKLRTILLVTGLCVSSVVSSWAADTKILSSDDRQLVMHWEQDQSVANVKNSADWASYFGTVDWRSEAGVQVPYKVLLVACPIGTTPRLTVHNSKNAAHSVGLPLSEGNEEASTYSGNAKIRVAHVERWRGFQIAYLELRLAESTVAGVSEVRSVDLTVEFVGVKAPEGNRSREEKLLSSLAVNGASATRWWQLAEPSRSVSDNSLDTWPEFQLYKLGLTETGLYSMTADWLQLQGIPVLGVPSSQVKVFGNGGRLLPSGLLAITDSVLRENKVLVEDGGDGRMDQGDRVIFYGEGLKGYDYCDGSHIINDLGHASPYATENVYWVGIDPVGEAGLRMESISDIPSASQVELLNGKAYLDQEQFIYATGPLQTNSGVVWYMATLDAGSERTFAINLESANTGRGKIRIRMDSISGSGLSFDVYVNNTPVSVGQYASQLVIDVPAGTFVPGNNVIRFSNNTTRQILLNYIEVEFERSLQTSAGVLEIYAPTAQTGAFAYSTGLANDAYWMDVTNPLEPRLARGSQFTDSSFANAPRRYFGSNPARIRTPLYRGRKDFEADDYSKLRDTQNEAGIIIVTYDDWYDELEPLIDMHAQYVEEPMIAVRVKLTHIYDEFSWGVTDPTAIRNFLRYAFDNWRGPNGNSEPPRYVLFVGDGDYDYRNLVSSSDDNWMPPWEAGQACTDDYFVDFDDTSALLDLLSGRWPVQNVQEVNAIVEKTVEYALRPLYGPWKNTATFVSDDEWKDGHCGEPFHTQDSESLINNVLPDYFTFRKLYEILYPFRQSTSTSAKPDGTRDLLETINNGTLLINYVGHGNERVWTDEQMFVMERDFPLIDNPRVWPVIVAGTCTWGGYDRPDERCFPELLLAGDGVGAIACIAATRFTFVSQNQSLTREYYTEIFRQGIETRRSLGEALLLTKPFSAGNKLYHTLGNPVLRLATPEYFAYVEERDDSLQAGGLFNMSGYVSRENASTEVHHDPRRRGIDEEVWADFQGIVEARVFDSEDSSAYYFPLPSDCSTPSPNPYYYGLPGNAIFRGRSSVVNGRFNVTFRVPRDIQYGGENAKVSLYFFGKSDSEPDSADGIGIERPLRIANAAAAVTDSVPPVISVWLENSSFRNGDEVSRSPLLNVRLSDESGLNLSGEVGHKITVRIDDAQAEDITQFYNYDVDSYTAGELSRTIGPLSEGDHRLTVEAWDSFNNLNLYTLDFVVGQQAQEGYAIRDVLNWPNPMSSETYFTYSLTQDGTSDVKIRIYTLSGKLVDELDGLGTRQLFNSNNSLPWNGRDREGHELANGVYFYKVVARHQRGYNAEATGKLVILR